MCQQSEDIDQTLMMFDNLPELRTGSSMKQQEQVEEFQPVTTTEVNDIFDDDEIWNHSVVEFAQHQPQIYNNNNINQSMSLIRVDPEEEYFRIVSAKLYLIKTVLMFVFRLAWL